MLNNLAAADLTQKNISTAAGRVLPTKKQSYISIDILRAVAALGVFYYHLHIGYLLSKYLHLPFLAFTDSFGATYAVPLFFLISGYCIHLSNIKYIKAARPLPLLEYYKRRILRIYPPYIAALIISIGIQWWIYKTQFTGSDIFIHLTLLQGLSVPYFNSINLVLWTISIEFAFYIIYPVFYYVRVKYSLNNALMLAAIVSVISIIFFSIQPSVSLVQKYFVLNIWFAWCCGAYLSDLFSLDKQRLDKTVYKLLYIVIVIAFLGVKMSYRPCLLIVDYQLDILIWTMPLMLMLRLELWFAKIHSLPLKVLSLLGMSSYSLYLLHEPLIELKNYAAHAFLPVKLQPAGVVAGIFIIPVICWFSYRYVEKPFMRGHKVVNG